MKKSELDYAVKNYRGKVEEASSFADDESALDMIELFPRWESGLSVKIGDRYQYKGELYKCVQAHTTQEDWTPDTTPALWTKISLDEWPEWVQPTGSQDAYNKGDKVTYKGKHYISTIDGNVWSPEAYPAGWNEVE